MQIHIATTPRNRLAPSKPSQVINTNTSYFQKVPSWSFSLVQSCPRISQNCCVSILDRSDPDTPLKTCSIRINALFLTPCGFPVIKQCIHQLPRSLDLLPYRCSHDCAFKKHKRFCLARTCAFALNIRTFASNSALLHRTYICGFALYPQSTHCG